METLTPPTPSELEVRFKPDSGKAVIEGKTVVPFQSLVTLILQRKVFPLFKQWGKEPVIVGSDLLTQLASAPQDSQENRGNLVLVSIGVGVIAGVGLSAAILALLLLGDITPGLQEYAIVLGSIAAFILLAWGLLQARRRKRSEKITEAMEAVTHFLSSK